MGNFKDRRLALQKSTNPQSKQFCVQETCTQLYGRVDVWITVSFSTTFPVT